MQLKHTWERNSVQYIILITKKNTFNLIFIQRVTQNTHSEQHFSNLWHGKIVFYKNFIKKYEISLKIHYILYLVWIKENILLWSEFKRDIMLKSIKIIYFIQFVLLLLKSQTIRVLMKNNFLSLLNYEL